ncbi:hypothetical protein [Bradyrhizobium sp. RD5-C2]|uniref:transketolase-like TK C-terminal-containing protein n=1 Tax=Bradyrhizobium sp. RD5-C2 TaxID=244562 RepID=UPI0035B52167
MTLIGTGSELRLAVKARSICSGWYPDPVISMPCTLIFDQQHAAYRRTVLGDNPAPAAVEAAVQMS